MGGPGSGGAGRGQGRAPIVKLRNRQEVMVRVTLAGKWVRATVMRERGNPDETILLLDSDIGHITISTAPNNRVQATASPKAGRKAKTRKALRA